MMVVNRKMMDKKGMDGVGMLCIGDKRGLFNHRRYNKEMWDNMKDYNKTSSFVIVTMVGLFISLSNYGGLL